MQSNNPTEEFGAMMQGLTLAIGFLTVSIAKHPGIDNALLLSDWKKMTDEVMKQTPQTTLPGAFALLKQFENMIREQVRPDLR